MRTLIPRFLNTVMLGAALTIPVVMTTNVLRADDRVYHDAARNEDHHWDAHEARAYRIWVKEQHRKYVDFAKLREEDRQAYWAWRHDHSDAVLHIDVR
jgi:hypothetical protein